MSEHISESISFVHNMTLSHGRNAEVWDTAGKRLEFTLRKGATP